MPFGTDEEYKQLRNMIDTTSTVAGTLTSERLLQRDLFRAWLETQPEQLSYDEWLKAANQKDDLTLKCQMLAIYSYFLSNQDHVKKAKTADPTSTVPLPDSVTMAHDANPK